LTRPTDDPAGPGLVEVGERPTQPVFGGDQR